MSISSFSPEIIRIAAAAQRAAYGDGYLSVSAYMAYLGETGWNTITGPGVDSRGFYIADNATAFALKRGDTIVIGIRGSADGNDAVPSDNGPGFDITGDWYSAAADPVGYYEKIRSFVQAVLDLAGPNTEIIIAGHSLGGQCATVLAALDIQPLIESDVIQPENISVVTFGAPGVPASITLGISGALEGRFLTLANSDDWVASSAIATFTPFHVGTGPNIYVLDETSLQTGFDADNILYDAAFGQTHKQSLYYQIATDLSYASWYGTWAAVGVQAIFALHSDFHQSPADIFAISNDMASAVVLGLSGNDTITRGSSQIEVAYISGGVGEDTVLGGAGKDYIDGGSDDDDLSGRGGDDFLWGGGGRDSLSGGLGQNFIDAGSGDDSITCIGGVDWIDGGTGEDTVTFNFSLSGADLQFVQSGSVSTGFDLSNGTHVQNVERVVVVAGSGNDTITLSDDADDVATGAIGDDILSGLGGRDALSGSGGDDALNGGDGDDALFGDGSTIERVSTSSSGRELSNSSSLGGFSFDGQLIAFANGLLAPKLWGGFANVFVKDLVSGALTMISTDATGQPGNNISYQPVFAPNSNTVAFLSWATNLVGNDDDDALDIFLKDLDTGELTLLAAVRRDLYHGALSPVEASVAFSSDGRFVAFTSEVSPLIAGETHNSFDIYLCDLLDGSMSLVSTSATGTRGNASSGLNSNLAFSPDGSKIVFMSDASNLVDGDTNNVPDIFLKDLATGDIQRISTSANGTQGNSSGAASFDVHFSADGNWVLFSSSASNLVANDLNNAPDIFMKNIVSGAIVCVSTNASGALVAGDPYGNGSWGGVFSPDSTKVAFWGFSPLLVAGDTNETCDVFLKDLISGAVTRISVNAFGVQGDDGSGGILSFSPDGSVLSFTSAASNLVPNDTYTETDVFGVVHSVTDVFSVDLGAILGGADVLNGGAGNDLLVGGPGNDAMDGGSGTDAASYETAGGAVVASLTTNSGSVGDAAGDTFASVEDLVGSSFADALTGSAADNVLVGLDGNDVLDGGAGGDQLIGGGGDDIYMVDSAADAIVEVVSGGADTVRSSLTYALGPNIENLVLTGTSAISGTGNTLNNALTGNQFANSLDGGTGSDTMIGGAGDDIYFVDDIGDTAVENSSTGGTDLVKSSVSCVLANRIENLTLLGTGSINATGNTLDNVLTGNDGGNILDGKAGADRMVGGRGNDTYVIDNANDVAFENASTSGTDLVRASVTFALADNLENLTLTGGAAINATGNTLANVITGNTGANTLNGGAGADTLIGGLGDDIYYVDNLGDTATEGLNAGIDTVVASRSWAVASNFEKVILSGTGDFNVAGNGLANTLRGNSGDNWINGSFGKDTLTGGGGRDSFIFNRTLGANNVDTITDYDVARDVIRIDNAVFTGIGPAGAFGAAMFNTGPAATEADDRIIYDPATGKLYFDIDGSGATTQVHFATLTGAPTGMSAGEFIII